MSPAPSLRTPSRLRWGARIAQSALPRAGHSVLWLAICTGALRVSGTTLGVELAVFDSSDAPVSMEADVSAQFVLGSAVPHPHPLVRGHYSVHTTPSALAAGEAGIRAVRERLTGVGLF